MAPPSRPPSCRSPRRARRLPAPTPAADALSRAPSDDAATAPRRAKTACPRRAPRRRAAPEPEQRVRPPTTDPHAPSPRQPRGDRAASSTAPAARARQAARRAVAERRRPQTASRLPRPSESLARTSARPRASASLATRQAVSRHAATSASDPRTRERAPPCSQVSRRASADKRSRTPGRDDDLRIADLPRSRQKRPRHHPLPRPTARGATSTSAELTRATISSCVAPALAIPLRSARRPRAAARPSRRSWNRYRKQLARVHITWCVVPPAACELEARLHELSSAASLVEARSSRRHCRRRSPCPRRRSPSSSASSSAVAQVVEPAAVTEIDARRPHASAGANDVLEADLSGELDPLARPRRSPLPTARRSRRPPRCGRTRARGRASGSPLRGAQPPQRRPPCARRLPVAPVSATELSQRRPAARWSRGAECLDRLLVGLALGEPTLRLRARPRASRERSRRCASSPASSSARR